MKYLFEVKEEITECSKCPIHAIGKMNEIYCSITVKGGSRFNKPYLCPLKELDIAVLKQELSDEILNELRQALESDKFIITATTVEPFTADQLKEAVEKVKPYLPLKHCGNCEHGNKYKEQEPCDSCKKQSNWKKRIFY